MTTNPLFKLNEETRKMLAARPFPFEKNVLGLQVYNRTYRRGDEEWIDTVIRVIEGTYRMQQRHIESNGLGWDPVKAQESAAEMAVLIYDMKFLPPGRGLWAMGTKITEEKGLFTALNNCAFVSTGDIASEKSMSMRFLMDVSMLGVGCGFDVKGAGKIVIQDVNKVGSEAVTIANPDAKITKEVYLETLRLMLETTNKKIETSEGWILDNLITEKNILTEEISKIERLVDYDTMCIDDTRDGWVASTGHILDSYMVAERKPVIFDYRNIRPAGIKLATFGGLSSGPEPLIELHIMIRKVLDQNAGKPITITSIVDIMNLIGKCIVSGNVRRSSEIALGPADSEEFTNLKNYALNPQRAAYGWGSNNSVFAKVGDDYSNIVDQIKGTGEPGIFWLENTQAYSRMVDPADWKDKRVIGTNPCSEQSLEDKELCCLCEVFIGKHASKEEFLRTLKFAFLYAKTVTLGESHWVATNRVMKRNRRIGTSISGITQFLAKNNLNTLREWCESGYNEIQKYDIVYSDWFAIPRSIKTTSIKPSGCVSADTIVKVYEDGNEDPISMRVGDMFVDAGANYSDYPADTWVVPSKPLFVDASGKRVQVRKLYVCGQVETVTVPTEKGNIVCTPNHKFWVKTIEGSESWIQAVDLEEGDELLDDTC